MKLILFLTFGNSLLDWKKNNIFNREIYPYIELKQKGIFTKIFSYGSEKEENELNLRKFDILTLTKNNSIKSKIYLFIKTLIFIKYNANKFDCDVIKTNQVWGAFAGVFLKYIINKPLVVRAGWEPYMQASQFRLNFFKLIIFFINSYIAYRFANHVIVSSNHIKNFISAKFKVNKLKITVINNYIDRNLFYINKKILDRKANRILFVGRLTKQKNLQELLHAISLTNFGLDIIGEGEDKSKLVKLVTKNKINVKFLGSINNKLIGSYYNNYKVFILPSYVEGNPKVLLEAMSCGCTVICSNVQGNNSIIKHKFNGYFVNTNRNSIKNGINEIMTNEQLQIKLNNNSIKYIEQYCDLEKNLLIEKNIYNLLVNEKKTIY